MKVLAFDPGLSITGWAYMSKENDIVTVHKFGTFIGSGLVDRKQYREQVEVYGRRAITLNLVIDSVTALMDELQPDVVACEDAFFNPRRPNAFEALMGWLTVVTHLLFQKYNKPITRIATRIVKKVIFGNGAGNKDDVMTGLVKKGVTFEQDTADIKDHESDAIGIGAVYLLQH